MLLIWPEVRGSHQIACTSSNSSYSPQDIVMRCSSYFKTTDVGQARVRTALRVFECLLALLASSVGQDEVEH